MNALCLQLLGIALLPLGAWAAARAFRSSGRPVAGVLLAASGLLFVGCSPQSGTGAHLESRLFDHVESIGTRGTSPGQLNKPRSLALDRSDSLFVVDMTGRVQKFAPDGAFLLSWQMPETDLGRPKGMGIDGTGRLIVIEPHYSRVNHFTTDGKLALRWGTHGTNAGQLAFPRAIAVNSRGEMWVSEYGVVDRIQRFTPDGSRLISSIGQFGSGPAEFNRPEGLGIGPRDTLYVADSCNHRIQVLDADGKTIASFGRAGTGPGELSYPYDVRVDSRGNVIVCEFGNSRIQVFDAAGKPVEVIGGPGAAPGRFSNPWSIALDSHDNLYVADAGNHRIQRLARRATPVTATAQHAPAHAVGIPVTTEGRQHL